MLFKTLIFASTASATCLHGLSIFKRAEEAAAEKAKFGYGPLDGPINWASLAPENEACKSGKNQSPINLDSTIQVATVKPQLSVPEVDEVEFVNLGTTIEVVANGTTTVGDTAFQLVQFHMHTPSEHHVGGEYHPLELHMVHQGVEDPTQLAVIGLMFQVSAGNSSSIISSLSSSLPQVATPGATTNIKGGIDYTDVISQIESSDILTYSGSLTTPPCSEGVTFMIVKDPLDVSVADYNAIKQIVKFNSRFIQNTLGQANVVEVGALAGTAGAIMPGVVGGNATVPTTPSNGTVAEEVAEEAPACEDAPAAAAPPAAPAAGEHMKPRRRWAY